MVASSSSAFQFVTALGIEKRFAVEEVSDHYVWEIGRQTSTRAARLAAAIMVVCMGGVVGTSFADSHVGTSPILDDDNTPLKSERGQHALGSLLA